MARQKFGISRQCESSRCLEQDAGPSDAEGYQVNRPRRLRICARSQDEEPYKVNCAWCFGIRTEPSDDWKQHKAIRITISSAASLGWCRH